MGTTPEQSFRGGWLHSSTTSYRVLSLLGKGSFGEVVKCTRMDNKLTVAVKIIKNRGLSRENAKLEIAALQKIKNLDSDQCNIVRWTTAFYIQGHVCLEFEHLDKSLCDFMKERLYKPLQLKEIRPIVYQVANALDHLKGVGIIHGDLKLDNVMLINHLREPYRIKVIDFSLACDASATRVGSVMQTRSYRAPEIILWLPFTEAIDMWSLGCMAASLYLGDLLYPGTNEYDMMRYIVETQGQPAENLLGSGQKTEHFFQKQYNAAASVWKLKSPEQFQKETGIEPKETRNFKFSSLDGLLHFPPRVFRNARKSANKVAERTDVHVFVDMVKGMLQLDASMRMTPHQVMEHHFTNMFHLDRYYFDSSHVRSCFKVMSICENRTPPLEGVGSTPSSTATPIPQIPPFSQLAKRGKKSHPVRSGQPVPRHPKRSSQEHPANSCQLARKEFRTFSPPNLAGRSSRDQPCKKGKTAYPALQALPPHPAEKVLKKQPRNRSQTAHSARQVHPASHPTRRSSLVLPGGQSVCIVPRTLPFRCSAERGGKENHRTSALTVHQESRTFSPPSHVERSVQEHPCHDAKMSSQVILTAPSQSGQGRACRVRAAPPKGQTFSPPSPAKKSSHTHPCNSFSFLKTSSAIHPAKRGYRKLARRTIQTSRGTHPDRSLPPERSSQEHPCSTGQAACSDHQTFPPPVVFEKILQTHGCSGSQPVSQSDLGYPCPVERSRQKNDQSGGQTARPECPTFSPPRRDEKRGEERSTGISRPAHLVIQTPTCYSTEVIGEEETRGRGHTARPECRTYSPPHAVVRTRKENPNIRSQAAHQVLLTLPRSLAAKKSSRELSSSIGRTTDSVHPCPHPARLSGEEHLHSRSQPVPPVHDSLPPCPTERASQGRPCSASRTPFHPNHPNACPAMTKSAERPRNKTAQPVCPSLHPTCPAKRNNHEHHAISSGGKNAQPDHPKLCFPSPAESGIGNNSRANGGKSREMRALQVKVINSSHLNLETKSSNADRHLRAADPAQENSPCSAAGKNHIQCDAVDEAGPRAGETLSAPSPAESPSHIHSGSTIQTARPSSHRCVGSFVCDRPCSSPKGRNAEVTMTSSHPPQNAEVLLPNSERGSKSAQERAQVLQRLSRVVCQLWEKMKPSALKSND